LSLLPFFLTTRLSTSKVDSPFIEYNLYPEEESATIDSILSDRIPLEVLNIIFPSDSNIEDSFSEKIFKELNFIPLLLPSPLITKAPSSS